MSSGRRYTPGYDATPTALFDHLAAHGMTHAVLVQPSFLGTDNSELLNAIAAHPERLRGVAVIDFDVSDRELCALREGGVVGVRFNLVGAPLPDLESPRWRGLLERVAATDWHVEIHREAHDLHRVVASALRCGVRVVVDHFGRPNPERGIDDDGFNSLLGLGASRNVWVKVSAAYRCSLEHEAFVVAAARRLIDAYGSDRLLWGSDWPHTQCESAANVAADLAALWRAAPDDAAHAAILGQTAAKLYRFAASISPRSSNSS